MSWSHIACVPYRSCVRDGLPAGSSPQGGAVQVDEAAGDRAAAPGEVCPPGGAADGEDVPLQPRRTQHLHLRLGTGQTRGSQEQREGKTH